MENKKQLTDEEIEKRALNNALNKYKNKENDVESQVPINTQFKQEDFQDKMSKETDEDLIIDFDIIKLPTFSGNYYDHNINEIKVEYMTSKDEDVITTPSLIENGTVLDVLLRRKIKTKGIKPENLLSGDRDAIILFLRSSSYGHIYNVTVSDPRTGNPFNAEVDLRKLGYKKIEKQPTENGLFSVELPMRKKMVMFKLLNSGEEKIVFNKAEAIKEAYGNEFTEFNTMKIKAQIVSINGKTDRGYIDKFVDAMPAKDAYTIRNETLKVMPGVDLNYDFVTPDGYKFTAKLQMGMDFFFPSN